MKAHMKLYAIMLARLLLALMLAPMGMPVLVVAQEAPRRSELSAESLIEAARTALSKGELEDAEFLLQGIKPGEGNVDDLDFLYGLDRDGAGGLANRHRPVPRHADP